MKALRKELAAAVLLTVVSASCADTPDRHVGRVVETEVVSGAGNGLELFEPVAVQVGGDRSVFILDRGNSELYRMYTTGAVDTVARKGAGPGELKSPTSFALVGDSAVIVADEGNARVQVIPLGSGRVRTIPYSQGAHSGVFDTAEQRFYAASYGQNFALVDGQPMVRQSSLISVLSTQGGEIVGHFGAPRPYPGKVIPIFGNMVRVARSPRDGDIWIGWPLEPVLERYGPDGKRKSTLTRVLSFEPPLPTEEQTARSPLPVADFQQVTFDLQIDSEGRIFILTPVATKTQKLQSEDYQPPAQAIDVLREDGVLECRINLPVTGTSFALAGPGELLLSDVKDTGEIYRIQYQCPS